MKLGHSACLATLVAFSAWFAACSSDNTPASNTDAGPGETGGSGGGSGGKAGSGGSGASAGKAGSGGTSSGGSAGSSGAAGKAGAAGAAGAAGSPPAGDAGDAGGGYATITIDSPKQGTRVGPGAAYPDYPDVPVAFTVTNFTLKAPQSTNCDDPNHCGHVHLIVDDASCNDPATPTLYNAAGFMSPINAGLDYCKSGVGGHHKIILELHSNTHLPVKGADGKVISASVNIEALLEDGGVPVDAGGAMTDH